jgi:hypothetical protein
VNASALLGHWSSESEGPRYSRVGDRIEFRREAMRPSYTWGGPSSGLRFDRDHHVEEFANTMCSDESDPVRDHEERWSLSGRILVIEGYWRRTSATVEVLDRRHLVLRVIETCEYKED